MKILKKILITAALIFSSLAQADLFTGQYSESQVFDVARSGCTTVGGSCSVYNFISPFIAPYTNWTHVTWAAGDYIKFVDTGTTITVGGQALPNLKLVQYNSSGNQKQVVSANGYAQAIGTGIVYIGQPSQGGGTGYFISNSVGIDPTLYRSSSNFSLPMYSPTITNINPSLSTLQSYGTSSTPLAVGQTFTASAVTVTGTSTTNTVTSTSTNGTPVTTVTDAPGTPIVTTATALNRGSQTTKTLAVNNVLTTVTYNPIITTTTVTTPVTVTTTTTPVTTTTYSDNTTTTTTGSAVVTTSSGTPIVSSSSVTVNGDPTVTTQVIQTWTTRIDGIDRIRQASDWTNQAMTGSIVERFTVDEKGVRQRIGAFGDEKQGWMYVIGEGTFTSTKDGYRQKGNVAGLGYDRRITPNLIVGGSYAEASKSLTGDQSGADSYKLVGTLYSLYGFNGWMVNTTLGYSNNKFRTYHGIQELNIMNTGTTNGIDNWFHNRVYTPEFNNVKLLVGVRTDRTRLNAYNETGDALTAMSYDRVNQIHTTNEYGFRWDKQLGKVVLGAEYAVNSDRLETSTVTIGFTPSSNILGNIGIRNQKQNGIENNVGFTSLTWRF